MNESTRLLIEGGSAGLELNVAPQWKRHGDSIVAHCRLKSTLSDPIYLTIRVPVSAPNAPTFLIRDGSASPNNAYRLDVWASHRNRKSDGRFWDHQTHLHVWTDRHKESHAIDPPGWPAPDTEPASSYSDLHLQAVMEYFCALTHVSLGGDYTWSNPLTLSSAPTETNLDGDEIP